jgi:lysine 2,3-aminomutase
VNDSADLLESLFRGLLASRVKPYYLFQGDLAAGTSHFRTDIATGLGLMRELSTRLSGLAMPRYAVDLPGGGGKAVITESTVRSRGDASYVVTRSDGVEFAYPREADRPG